MARGDPQFRLRLPPELKEKIDQEAEINSRTIGAEITRRLFDSFEPKENTHSDIHPKIMDAFSKFMHDNKFESIVNIFSISIYIKESIEKNKEELNEINEAINKNELSNLEKNIVKDRIRWLNIIIKFLISLENLMTSIGKNNPNVMGAIDLSPHSRKKED